jgi:hypothetical protein
MRRTMIRGLFLLIAVAVIYFAPEPADDQVVPAVRNASTSPVGKQPETVPGRRPGGEPEILAIQPRLFDGQNHEPFVPTRWAAPPPPVKVEEAAPAPPPPPQAPPLPFKVAGQYREGDQIGVFLLHNDKMLIARVGDTLAGQYQVESLQGDVMTLIYLPLQQPQTLTISPPR